jgi:hypothetical protein
MASKTLGSPVTVEWVRGKPPQGIGELKVGKASVLGVSINEKTREFRIMLWDKYWRMDPLPRRGQRKKELDKIDGVKITVMY